jgi:hypothetical protein
MTIHGLKQVSVAPWRVYVRTVCVSMHARDYQTRLYYIDLFVVCVNQSAINQYSMH